MTKTQLEELQDLKSEERKNGKIAYVRWRDWHISPKRITQSIKDAPDKLILFLQCIYCIHKVNGCLRQNDNLEYNTICYLSLIHFCSQITTPLPPPPPLLYDYNNDALLYFFNTFFLRFYFFPFLALCTWYSPGIESFTSPIMMATISGSFKERISAFSIAEHSLPLVNTSIACFAAFPTTKIKYN